MAVGILARPSWQSCPQFSSMPSRIVNPCIPYGSRQQGANTILKFALAFFVLLDAAVFSKSPLNGSDPPIHITFIDWLPLIFSSFGMLIINSIEKSRLAADSFSYSGSGVAWKARVVLFLGFASLAGGMAGGVVVLVLKYVVEGVGWPVLGMGVANVAANALVGLR